MSTVFNVTISGVSISGDLDTSRTKLGIDLGNSDKIGKVEFSVQNKDGTYTSKLFSGNATYQIDAIQGGSVVKSFRGWLEESTPIVDTKGGSQVDFVGYDYAQELLGLVSPDGRQKSTLNSNGTISLTSGDQGMGASQGMDLVLYVSGIVSSGSANAPPSFIPVAANLSQFMKQYFGESGDTTGSASGALFSFKSYFSGMTTWGTNPFYRTWYAEDTGGGGADTNSNYWLPYDTVKAKHEYAWDVLRKITRQAYAVDRSGTKVQFETYIDGSGAIHLRTSGTSDFLSNATLIYYQAGKSGASLNNVLQPKVPWKTTDLKDYILGWFPTWTQYPFGDDYTDLIAYSGGYWGTTGVVNGPTPTLSGNAAGPGAPGFISIMGTGPISGIVTANGGFALLFTLWSGYSLNISRWNVSGGNGVNLTYLAQGSSKKSFSAANNDNYYKSVVLYDLSGNYIIKSGNSSSNQIANSIVNASGWTNLTDVIYTASGTFLSGTGQDGGWASSATFPDLTNLKQIALGFYYNNVGGFDFPTSVSYMVDNLAFSFAFDYNPVVAFNSGSQFAYGRRYEVFEFPYQTTDSGAASIVIAELQGKMLSRQLAEFQIVDNPNGTKVQLSITPGQAFQLDAPVLAAGSGQYFNYFVATEVKHEWSTKDGFITSVKAYPWFSGSSPLSGQNLISYSLPLAAPTPNVVQKMPLTTFWTRGGGPRG